MATLLPIPEIEQFQIDQGDMALNENDRAWIRQEINASHKRHGWLGFLKDWGGLLGIGGLIVFFIVQWGGYIEFRTKVSDRLTLISKSLEKLDPNFANSELSQIGRVDKQAIQQARAVVETAKSNHLSLNPSVVEVTGKKLVEASNHNADAWDTALEFVDYKSDINHSLGPVPQPSADVFTTKYGVIVPAGMDGPRESVSGIAPPDSEAIMDLIGVNQNEDLPKGRAYIFVENGNQILDNFQFRNVVFRNMTLYYDSGTIKMTNVYFINCKFVMKATRNSQGLAIAALSAVPATTFNSESSLQSGS